MITVCCPVCWIEYGIPKPLDDKMRADKPNKSSYCPNGHTWFYMGENEAAMQRRRAERAEQMNAQLQDEARKAIKQRNAVMADLKRHQRRARAGLCPCCNRSFVKLAAHIKTKHPNYAGETSHAPRVTIN